MENPIKLHAEHLLRCNEGMDVFFEGELLVVEYEIGLRFKFDKVVTEMVKKACLAKQKEEPRYGDVP